MVVFGTAIPLRFVAYAGIGLAILLLGVLAIRYDLLERLQSKQSEPSTKINREQVQVAFVGVLLFGGASALVYWAFISLPFLLFVLYSLLFLFGLAFVPLLAFTVGPSLGSFIPEFLSNLLWIISMAGVRRGVLKQKETDEYVIERARADMGPLSYWSRWALIPFGITFEATEQAFHPTVAAEQLKEKVDQLGVADGGEPQPGAHVSSPRDSTTSINLSRGGDDVSWFATESDRGKILVPLGQKLAELRNAAGPEMGIEAYAESLKEHGGDTSGATNRVKLVGSLVFVVLGFGLAHLFF